MNDAGITTPPPGRDKQRMTQRIRRAIARGFRTWRRRRATKGRTKRLQPKILTLTLAMLLASFGWALAYLAPDVEGNQIRLDQLSRLADDERLVHASFLDEDAVILGSFDCERPRRKKAPSRDIRCPDKGQEAQDFWMSYPRSGIATTALLQTTLDAGADASVDPQITKGQVRTVSTFLLPLMVLANLFALLFSFGRGGSAGIGEVILFGSMRKGRVRRRSRSRQPITFADVGGADDAVAELREVVDYLRAPERYRDIGAMPPRGVLMIGPPGCGKTLLAKAAAGEAEVPFFSVAGAEFVESLVGVGAARVRDLFQRVRASAPAIVFIDELDAAGRRRGVGAGGGGTDEREQTLNQMLVEMDGFEPSAGIVVVGATNRPDILDPALLRPGRFDRHIVIDRPDREGRAAILKLHARGRRLAEGADFEVLARRTPGFSGADLANALNEAALLAVRAGKLSIDMADLLEGIERVRVGPQRRGRVLGEAERRQVATHESGHAIVAAALGKAADVHRVSILGQGRLLGATTAEGDEDRALLKRSDLQQRLVTAMGGMAAEEMAFGEPSTGAERDLEVATELARDMVARYGMSATIGRARLLARDVDAFLDLDVPYAQMSPETQERVDQEIRALLDGAERAAGKILAGRPEALEALVARLETDETLEGPDLEAMLETVSLAMPDDVEAWLNGAAKPRTRARRPSRGGART